MTVEEAYKILQAEWVKLYDAEVGDMVKVLRTPTVNNELGSFGYETSAKGKFVGQTCKISRIDRHSLFLDETCGYCFPFFCLEFVKKAKPKIEITVKVNGKEVSLKSLSEETLLNIRKKL